MNGWPIKAYRCVGGIRLGNNRDRHEKGQYSVRNVGLRGSLARDSSRLGNPANEHGKCSLAD